jgi:methyl-accepting chemotaxis protein
MKIKYKAPLWLLSATIIMTTITAYSNYNTNVALIESAKTTELKMVATQIQNDLIDQGNSAASKVALIIQRPDVQAAFRAQDRATLTALMLPSFTVLKNKFGVRESQFNLIPATVFLRLHNLPLFGDDNSSFREMILMAIKNKKGYQGLEIGRSGINIRAIEPIKDAKGIMGTFEIGMSLGTILEDIKKNTEFDAAIFINDALITKIATSRPRAGPERIFGDLQGIGSSDWSKVLPYMDAETLNTINDVTLITKNINGTDYGMIFMPLLDFKNTEIGTIVAISDYSHYQAELRSSLIKNIAFALFEILVVTGVMIITFRVMLLRPINHINQVIREWLNGKEELNLDNLDRKNDEIGYLASNLEALHNKNDDK